MTDIISGKTYVSYTRRSKDTVNLVGALAKQVGPDRMFFGSRVRAEKPDILYDENVLKPGESIKRFMRELAEGNQIVFVVSDSFFRSPYCMYELSVSYSKQADRLCPVVVLVENFTYSQDKVQEVIEYWQEQAKQSTNSNAVELYKNFVDKTPKAMAWLFGPIDSFGNADRLAISYDGQISLDTIIRQILEQLSLQPSETIFKCFSDIQRKEILEKAFEQYLGTDELDIFKGVLVEKFGVAAERLHVFLADMDNANSIENALDASVTFLKKEDTLENAPSEHQKRMCHYIRCLFGLILAKAVDWEKLDTLVRSFNQSGDSAREFHPEDKNCYQILVSAIFNKPATYQYDNSSGNVLKGEGELEQLDKGIKSDTFKNAADDSQRFLVGFDWLAQKVRERRGVEPRGLSRNKKGELINRDLHAHIKALNDLINGMDYGLYLPVDPDWLDSKKGTDELTNRLGKELPKIVQMTMIENNSLHIVNDYFLNGLNRPKTVDTIEFFYKEINRILHGKRDDT